MRTLSKLLALANRPGTPEEGEQARRAAERAAAREGKRILELTNGTLLPAEPLDDDRAAMLDELDRFANPRAPEELGS